MRRKLFALLVIAVITTFDLNAQWKDYIKVSDFSKDCYYFCGNKNNGNFKYKCIISGYPTSYAIGKYVKKQSYYLLKYDILSDTIFFEYDTMLSKDTLYFVTKDYFGEELDLPLLNMTFIVFDTIENAYKNVETEYRWDNDSLYKIERKVLRGKTIEYDYFFFDAFSITIPENINKIVIIGYYTDLKLAQYQFLPKILKKISKTQLQDFQTGEIFEYKKNVTFVYDKKNK
ncbi:MAG: hypothetical protein IKJ56_01930 [Bacteroidales bacterium]|nr:hypothetical protein [Bacteroidales bacterium]